MPTAYQLIRRSYTDKATGRRCESPTIHIHFRDHENRRQRFTGGRTEKGAHHVAGKLVEIAACRRTGAAPSGTLRTWLDSLNPADRARLVTMDLIDGHADGAGADRLLTV